MVFASGLISHFFASRDTHLSLGSNKLASRTITLHSSAYLLRSHVQTVIMVSTTITFEKDNIQPPVFVAGGFTDWQPIEMTCDTRETTGSVKNVFSHTAELEPGIYQYKFRLGPGDWWVLDEATSTGRISSFLCKLR